MFMKYISKILKVGNIKIEVISLSYVKLIIHE